MEAEAPKPGNPGRQGGTSLWLWPACVVAWGIALASFVILGMWLRAKEVNAATIGEVLRCGGNAGWRYCTISHGHASEWKWGLAREHWLGFTASIVMWLACSYFGRWLYRRIKSSRPAMN